ARDCVSARSSADCRFPSPCGAADGRRPARPRTLRTIIRPLAPLISDVHGLTAEASRGKEPRMERWSGAAIDGAAMKTLALPLVCLIALAACDSGTPNPEPTASPETADTATPEVSDTVSAIPPPAASPIPA